MPKAGADAANAAAGAASASSRAAACLECRLNKTRCRPSVGAADTGQCLRCRQFGFECRYAQQHKRGRKPRSKVQGAIAAAAHIDGAEQQEHPRYDASLSLLANTSSTMHDVPRRPAARLRQRAWLTLTRSAFMRGSTYTFVAAGNTELEGERGAEQVASSSTAAAMPPNSSTASTGYETPTLRKLLRRVDQRFGGGGSHGSTAAQAPPFVDLSTPSDPRAAGLLSEAECSALVRHFDRHMLPWTAALASAAVLTAPPSPTWADGFLLSVVAYAAARFTQSPQQDTLGTHARSLAVQAFAKVDTAANTVLALDLLAVWKAPDDDFSDAYAGYADHIVGVTASALVGDTPTSRQALRIHVFHYVQRSVYQLHCVAASSTATTTAAASLEHTLPLELPGDWFLASDAESTSMQCRFKALFLRQARWGHTAASCLALLDAFCAEMAEWERRWWRIAKAQEDRCDAREHRVHRCGFAMLGKSVCMHITSIAFRRGLDAWRDAAPATTAAGELVQRSYGLCIDSCVGLLRVVPQLEPSELLHMPDSIMILINHAALMAVYLLLAPAAVAQRGSARQQPPNVWSGYDDGGRMAQECIDAIQAARDALLVAAHTCPAMESTCALSAEHLASLTEMMCDDDEDNDDVGLAAREADVLEQDVHFDYAQANAGWDWLQAFLDDSAALPLFLTPQQQQALPP